MTEEKISRRRYLKYAAGIAVTAAVAGAAGYLAKPAPPTTPGPTATTTTPAEKVLIVAVETDMSNLDPHNSAPSRPSQAAFAMINDTLIEVHRERSKENPDFWLGHNVDLQDPALAERVEWAEDGLSATYHVRKGVKFHDGRELTADDMIWTYERFAGWQAGYGPMYTSAVGYLGTEKVDDYTFRIKFKAKSPMPRKWLALKENSIVLNSKLVKEKGVTADDPFATSWLRSNDAGCGPYYLELFAPSSEVHFRAFKDYWRGKPPVDRVIFKFVPEAADRVMLLRAGTIDMISPWAWTPRDIPTLRTDPNIVVYETAHFGILQFIPNHTIEPFGEKLVRKALQYAIPMDTILTNVMYGTAVAMKSPLPAGIPTYTDEFYQYKYDLDTAKQLLSQTKYANGFTTDLYHQVGQVDQKEIAEWLASEWGKIGVTVNIKSLPAAAYTELEKSGDMPLHYHVFTPFIPDPYYTFKWTVHSPATHTSWPLSQHYKNERVDSLIDQYFDSTDEQKRLEASKEIQSITVDELPQFLLTQRKAIVPARKGIRNVTSWYDQCIGRGMNYITKD